MNRHGKFYAELAAELADDEDDDYDYDDDEYYEDGYEEEEEYAEVEAKLAEAPPPPWVNPLSTVSPETDEDFEVLAAMILQVDELWKKQPGIPVLEEEAVESLRLHEYDPVAAVSYIAEQRAAKKSHKSRSLKVVGSTKATAEEKRAETESKEETVVAHEYGSGFGSLCGSPASPVSGKFTTDCTLVITGHVDAGKSTILGHLLLLLGKVSESELQRTPSSVQYAWLLDQSEEERRRGVTIDSGTFSFQTAHRRLHVLDAPGHKEYVLSMISSATQADAALLIVTATHGEFEAGLSHGTKEHLMVLRTLGVGSIIIAVNKMDAVQYSEERFNHVVEELKALFAELRISDDCIAGICPVSATDGTNMISVDHNATPWYTGSALLDLLDTCPMESRLLSAPLRITLQDVQQNTLYAKVESGRVKRGAGIVFQPGDIPVSIKGLQKSTGEPVMEALAGDQVEIVAKATPVGLYPGCVGCERHHQVPVSTDFEVRIQTFECLRKPLLPGSSLIMVAHAIRVSVKVVSLVSKFDANGRCSKGMVKCVPANTQAIVTLRTEFKVALEPVEFCRALGRFVLSQDGENVAGGLLQKVIPV